MTGWAGWSIYNLQRLGAWTAQITAGLTVLWVEPRADNDDRFHKGLKNHRILNLVQIGVPICTLMVKGGGPLTMRGIC